MDNLILRLFLAEVVAATLFIQIVRPLPVIVESSEFERDSYGEVAEEYALRPKHPLRHTSVGDGLGPHVKRKSIDIPKLVQDLYRNVTAISDSQDKYPTMAMEYNTVRSFEGTINHDCSTLTFDVAAIEEREFIFKAEIYLDVSYNMDVVIELELDESTKVATTLNHPSNSERVIFQIGQYLADRINSNSPMANLHFNLSAWKLKANTETRLTCNHIDGYIHSDPSLVVYSYDTKEELLETIQKKLLDSSYTSPLPSSSPLPSPSPSPSLLRAKREPGQTCDKTSMKVNKKVLNDIMEGTYRTITEPSEFDTGVCAGSCVENLPQETLHSSILHLLLSSSPNEPARINETTSYQKCCAPIEYSAMSMITILKKPNQNPVFEIKVFHDLSVKRCACIYSKLYV